MHKGICPHDEQCFSIAIPNNRIAYLKHDDISIFETFNTGLINLDQSWSSFFTISNFISMIAIFNTTFAIVCVSITTITIIAQIYKCYKMKSVQSIPPLAISFDIIAYILTTTHYVYLGHPLYYLLHQPIMIVLETVLLFQMVYYKQLRKIYFALFICIEILLINGLCFAQLIDKDSYDGNF